ncbi:MAG: hypothetical protein AMXMBFR58_11760 [Phycisphaerae bacterium]
MLKGITSVSGPDCLRVLTRSLAEALGVRYAVLAEFLPEKQSARSLAFWTSDRFADNVEWTLAGTPCRDVVGGQFSHFPDRLQQRFPEDPSLVDLGAVSYLGVPLFSSGAEVIGHLFVMDTRPMPAIPRNLALFRLFAARAAGELSRLKLEQALSESQSRLKDLFDEAPIAYVHEGVDSKFIRANRTAQRILGLKPEEVPHTYGKDLVPNTPEAQRRVAAALDSIGRGTDTSGMLLELRRKDDGKPVWIEWWTRPDPSGTYTRTMFIDVTQRVLGEQERARLEAQNSLLREELDAANNFGEIVGKSPALAHVLESVRCVAPTDSTVLIEGETGTGKELIARALHDLSTRRQAPFIKVNCAALPAGLVESEFFGHEKGAFTGAVSARRGRFELADGGTIFLDEVGEVSPEVQVKLLRVLQESEFERVGGSETIRVNVRVIAATNRNLTADVAAGRFRADLFYRLNVFPLRIPPLRDRVSDIPLLTTYFVTQLASTLGKHFDGINQNSMDRLIAYAWPGNIRELRNLLERAVILSPGPMLNVELGEADRQSLQTRQGAPEVAASENSGQPEVPTLEDMERRHILDVLRQTNGAIAGPKGAAKLLGLPPSTLRSRMERLGIDAEQARQKP